MIGCRSKIGLMTGPGPGRLTARSAHVSPSDGETMRWHLRRPSSGASRSGSTSLIASSSHPSAYFQSNDSCCPGPYHFFSAASTRPTNGQVAKTAAKPIPVVSVRIWRTAEMLPRTSLRCLPNRASTGARRRPRLPQRSRRLVTDPERTLPSYYWDTSIDLAEAYPCRQSNSFSDNFPQSS